MKINVSRLLTGGFLSALISLGVIVTPNPVQAACDAPESVQEEELCTDIVRFLPHYRDDFSKALMNGRYALDCDEPGGTMLIERDGEYFLQIDGVARQEVHRTVANFGPHVGPPSFIFSLAFRDARTAEARSLSVNGDQYGFYLVEEYGSHRRLGQCK